MGPSLLQVLLSLAAGIGVIILLTARYRVHAFFALFLACFVVGLGVQLPVAGILKAMKEGLGHIMQSLGLIIVLGTTLGVLLEHTGCTRVMAAFILRLTGERFAALAMGITGFIVGLPIFCDSGYIVLSGLNRSLAARTGISILIMSVTLATSLYTVHCLIPPHPGATAAAGIIGADFGKLMMMGLVVAIPPGIAGGWWAHYAGRKIAVPAEADPHEDRPLPSLPVWLAFMPVVVPIALIALAAFGNMNKAGSSVWKLLEILGDPVIALTIGVLLAFLCGGRSWKRDTANALLVESVEKAAGILVVIGAGGAFGGVLAATGLGKHFSGALSLGSLGIIFPFLLAALLKTAQGSSTVAIITAASIIQPLLPALGLTSDTGKLLCMLALGGGSMMISHANDAYFWVISKFSGLDMKPMLRVYSTATLIMGLTTLAVVYILSLLML